jgi:uncharacterized membrane protein YphA (DoxX/SURF4 family)
MVAVIRVALGIVMLAAAVGKLSNRAWPSQARALGAPIRLIPLVAPVELALGAALVTGIVPRVAAGATGVLLALFTALLVVRLQQGRRPPCACFGGRRPRPIDHWSVIRNVVLVAAAVSVVAFG